MQNLLMQKASEAIASLWLSNLETISSATGIELVVLCNCLNLQVPPVPPVPPVPVLPPPSEKKKRAPPKKKESVVVDVAPPATTDGPTEVPPTEVPPPAEKKKRAPAKKKEAVVVDFGSDDDEVATEVPPTEVHPTEVPPPAEKKKKAPAKKKEATKSKTNMKINDDEEVSCSGDTVIMPPDRIDVEEVFIGATSFLVAENNTAYLKSSRQPVGKYDHEQKTIHPHIADNDEDEEDDERDECPILSDMSDEE